MEYGVAFGEETAGGALAVHVAYTWLGIQWRRTWQRVDARVRLLVGG